MVSDEATADTEGAAAALRSGDWQAARDAYLAAANVAPTGEVHFGLGVALWWLGETEASLRSWEQAYAAFRRQSDHAQAVLAAFYLCLGKSDEPRQRSRGERLARTCREPGG